MTDLSGTKFNRLSVLRFSHKNNKYYWLCRCDCGTETVVERNKLVSGHTKSCGCYAKEQVRVARAKTRKNLLNKKFGSLTVISFSKIVGKVHYWNCICDCGREIEVKSSNLNERTKSCGCKRGEGNKTHGMSKTRIYNIWQGMNRRCFDETNIHYKEYGGRGITVCKKWLTFDGFYEDMKDGYANNLTLDRYPNNNGNYEKSNCRWADYVQQANNTRKNVFIEYGCYNKTISEWAKYMGISYSALSTSLFTHKDAKRVFAFYQKKHNFEIK